MTLPDAFGLYSPWVVVAALTLALGTTALLVKWQGAPASTGRFVSIDGLRGFLAFFVFLHHGCFWYVQLHQQTWGPIASPLYQHLGGSSVALFFMITAFLFTTKVIDSDRRPIDWVQLYVSRVMRLLPLYVVAAAVVWLMAWSLTGWTLQVPLRQLLSEAVNWLFFTIPRGETVNGLAQAHLLMAGVAWSLRFEWWFYLCLPALAFLLRKQRVPLGWVLFGVLNLLLFKARWHLDERAQAFLGGMVAAWVVRHEPLCHWARQRWVGLVVLACLAGLVTLAPYPGSLKALLLLSVAFTLIACGNDVFGLLSAGPSRLLGDMTYSLYLLHGLLLTFVIRWVVGVQRMATWTPAEHWGLVIGLTVPLILLSAVTYHWIERPAQAAVPALMRRIRRHTGPRPTLPHDPAPHA